MQATIDSKISAELRELWNSTTAMATAAKPLPPAATAKPGFFNDAVEVILEDGRMALVTRRLATDQAYLQWVSGLFPGA